MQVSAAAPGLGYIPYTAPVTGSYSWLDLATVAREDIANAFTVGGQSITSEGTAVIPLVLKGASSQSVDLLQIQNSSATVLGGFGNTGNLRVRTTIEFSGALNVAAASSTQIGAVIRGAASQSANLQEWQNSAGGTVAQVSPFGVFTSGQNVINAVTSTVIPLLVKGNASGSMNLQEWQNSGGTAIASVGSGGSFLSTSWSSSNGLTVIGEVNSGGTLRMARATAASAPPANQVRIMVLAGTTGSKLVAVGPGGGTVTLADNLT
jgi:hypothetical protein